MEYRNFSNSKIQASILGFGGWQLGNSDMWNGPTFNEGVALVQEAVKAGITFFDTAPGYSNGLSERILGQALKGYRDQVLINTKFGHTADGETDFKVESMESRVLESCERLETTYLDGFILHNPSTSILRGDTLHFQELKRLKNKGLIKSYGVSVDTLEELQLIIDFLDLDLVEVMFNIIHQEPSKAFKALKKKGISIVIKVPFDSGWLTGRFNKDSNFKGIRARWSQKVKEDRDAIICQVKTITKKEDLISTSLAFIKSFEEVTTIIPGTKNSTHLHSNLKAIEYQIEEKEKNQLLDLYATYISTLDTPW